MNRLPFRLRLVLAAALILGGIGPATAMAGPLPRAGMSQSDAGLANGPTDAPKTPAPAQRPGAARLGDGDCCKSPACRCGCLYSVAGAAVARLAGH